MPLAERQSFWMSRYLTGQYHLPPRSSMARDVRQDTRARARYKASPRHTIEVEFEDYMALLRLECLAGAVRAKLGGNRLPIEARAEHAGAATHVSSGQREPTSPSCSPSPARVRSPAEGPHG
jgi:hypothetical protein